MLVATMAFMVTLAGMLRWAWWTHEQEERHRQSG